MVGRLSPLNRKLVRDLWRLRGQVLAIATVIASGVAVLIMALAAIEALRETAAGYYERYRFAQVFASVKRAPERLVEDVAALAGVETVESRIVKVAILDMPDLQEPVLASIVSIPERRPALLNKLALRAGRFVSPGRHDEVIISEPFAEAHDLTLNDTMVALINGRKRRLTVVGIALSPEYVYAIAPGGLMPDDDHYGVLWMGRDALAAAYDLEGSFNNLSLTALRGANVQDIIDRLDTMLAPYGSTGAFARKDQVSNWFLMNEIQQLQNISQILPTIFLLVAAFLTNMVLGRLIATERAEIGLLKAFGYSNVAIGWHYIKMVSAMAGVGIAMGWFIGYWLGWYDVRLYGEFFWFPFLLYRPGGGVFIIAAAISLAAALSGTIGAVRQAVLLPPAEAMRPPQPPLFTKVRAVPLFIARVLDQPTRMILRQLLRWPVRSILTSFGIGMSIAVLVMSLQWLDAIDHLVDVYFFQTQRQDLTIALVEARSTEAVRGLENLPGVLSVEPARFVAARLRHGNRSRREAVQGILPDAQLNLVYDSRDGIVEVPPEGLVIGTELAKVLGVQVGDIVTVEILEEQRPVLDIPVVATFETYIGTPAYMDLAALNRAMRTRPTMNIANLTFDSAQEASLFAALKEQPQVAAAMLRRAAVDTFHDTMAETLIIFISFFVAFACTLAFGTVYNSARIALSERGRELATLRVLGFTRGEISYILLGEVALLTFWAMPLGCLIGFGLAAVMAARFATELFRVPLMVQPETYGIAVMFGLAAATVSALLVRRRVDRLDLIAVLKTRE